VRPHSGYREPIVKNLTWHVSLKLDGLVQPAHHQPFDQPPLSWRQNLEVIVALIDVVDAVGVYLGSSARSGNGLSTTASWAGT